MELQIIQTKIYELRGQKILLDFDLAELYDVETRVFNQAVKRNIENFPVDFMFRITSEEWQNIASSQIVMIVKLPKNRMGKYLPYAFTEHGVTMLASILKSEKARKMNIAIVRAFIALRHFVLNYNELAFQIKEIKESLTDHDERLIEIYKALELLLTQKHEEVDFENRKRIGFNK